jgi:hypothetical protein
LKNNGRRDVWRRCIDSSGCEDHEGSLGLFREALEAEIRLDKNPIVSSLVVGEKNNVALGERAYYL